MHFKSLNYLNFFSVFYHILKTATVIFKSCKIKYTFFISYPALKLSSANTILKSLV